MIIIKCYRFLFYNLYLLWLRKKDEPENAHINAVITITFFFYVNLISIPLLLMAIFRKEIIPLSELIDYENYIIIGFAIITGMLNFIYLGRKKKLRMVIDEFKNVKENLKRKGFLLTIYYLIISIAIPMAIFIFTKPLNT